MQSKHNFDEKSTPTNLPSDEPAYVRLRLNSKQPEEPNWQNNPLTRWAIDQNSHNIGLLLGKRTGLVDIDCDCSEAVHLAQYLLPKPALHFQRNGSSAHYIYRCNDAEGTVQRGHSSTFIELRGTGGQTMIPPSVHPDGDQLEWSIIPKQSGPVAYVDLLKLVNLIAAGCLVAQEYSEGSRHFISLGFAGLVRKAGFDQDTCETVIQSISSWANDGEDRTPNVTSTYQQNISSVSGYHLLKDHLDKAALNKICDWFGVNRDVPALDGEVLDDGDTGQMPRAITSDTISEAVLSENFAQEIEGAHCFVPQEKQWRYWDGSRWMPDDRNVFGASFMDYLKAQRAKTNDYRTQEALQSFETWYKANSVAKLTQASRAVDTDQFDQKDTLLNCPNGVVDLSSSGLKRHDPFNYLTKQTTTAFDPEASAPRFERFVLEICDGDEDLAGYLQRVAGYALEGGNPEQVMFILHGNGANGKSTFVEICSEVLGGYAKTAPASVLVEGRSGGVGDDLVFLKGARWINASETGQGAYLAESKLKQITGGDTTAGRALYASYQEFQLSGVVLFSTNHLPRVRGTDEGIWRRMNVIEFKRTFKENERDPYLKDSLRTEKSGILNWMLEGHRRYKASALQPPACVQDANRRYRKDMDVVSAFLEECCEFASEARCNQTILKNAYERYCQDNGRSEASWRDLTAALEARGLAKKKSNGQRFWSGIKLTEG